MIEKVRQVEKLNGQQEKKKLTKRVTRERRREERERKIYSHISSCFVFLGKTCTSRRNSIKMG